MARYARPLSTQGGEGLTQLEWIDPQRPLDQVGRHPEARASPRMPGRSFETGTVHHDPSRRGGRGADRSCRNATSAPCHAPRTPVIVRRRPARRLSSSSTAATPGLSREPRDRGRATAPTSTFVSLQDWDDDALHLASQFASIGRDARLNHFVITLGGSVVRVNPSAHLVADGARRRAATASTSRMRASTSSSASTCTTSAPHTRSRGHLQGCAAGRGARARSGSATC